MMYKYIIVILIFTISLQSRSLNYVFALVPKNINSSFFMQASLGCSKAAKELNVKCVYIGSEEANPRSQVKTIEDLIEQKVDGIAVSVIDSNHLIKSGVLQKAQKQNIPIITFDSDLSDIILKKYPNIRKSYIGTNNFEFGQELGKALIELRPKGGSLCIQSGWKNSKNLNERVEGIRSVLLETNNKVDLTKRLNNETWIEHKRCPAYSNDDVSRALFQLTIMLKEVDAFVSVGGWAQYSDNYPNKIQEYKYMLWENKKTLIIASTQPVQIKLLEKKLSMYNIGQNPFATGELAIETLYAIKLQKKVKNIIHTPLTKCSYKNYLTCLK